MYSRVIPKRTEVRDDSYVSWSRGHAATRGLLMVAGFCAALPALAVEGGADLVEEIVVTGSRLKRDANLTGALPVQTVDSDTIRLSGEFSVTDVINDVPALLNSTTSEQSTDSDTFDDGANILNLRGLGSTRTLVLVDGRRHVGGVQGSSAVDVGSIPLKLIDRVEVLTGGASAVYGADAVTGVVNFILKDDFEGFEVDANVGFSEKGDGEQASIAAVWGRNFNDGRGNITASIDYRADSGLQVSDRGNGALIGSSRDWVNPALRFQQGDNGAGTPNLARVLQFRQYRAHRFRPGNSQRG